MGWPGPRRTIVVIRMSDDRIAAVDATARSEGLCKTSGEANRSEMIRRATDLGLAVLARWPGAGPEMVAKLELP